ncbi:MAG: HAD hydrolase-like protein [Candidatus Anammoxibacter sp.]
MKCLIIAAGKGSRLQRRGKSKPLIPVLGVSLIERVIRSVTASGISDFYIVTGYQGECVQTFLDALSKRLGINVTFVVNNEWEKENGYSVLKAKGYLNEPFLLLMADHLFDPVNVNKLIKHPLDNGDIVLGVDKDVNNPLIDLNDVTKVFTENGEIRKIGKGLTGYNGFDTGIFLCTTAIFNALERRSSEFDDTTLSGAVQLLAATGNVKVHEIEGYWIDVDDEKAFKKAEKLLCDKLIKPADGFISRYINRKFSIRIFTPLFLKIYRGITPNQVSILSFVVGLVSSLYFFLGHAVIGALLIQLSSILDGCDGEIARLKHMQSSFGDFLDAILDRYADSFILAGIFYYSLTEIGSKEIFGIYCSPLFIIGIFVLAILGNLMVSYSTAKSVANFGYRYTRKWIAAGKGRDLRLFLLFIGGILTYFHPVFAFLALFIIAIQTNTIVIWRTFLSWYYFLHKDSLIKNKVKAVIFDFDGTIADTMPFLTELAVKLMTEAYDISKPEAEKRYLETTGLAFENQIELIFPNHPKNHEVVTTFESRKLEGVFAHPIFSEVIPTLKYFRNRGIKTFICSSTKQEIITKYIMLNKIDDLVDGFFGYKSDSRKGEQIDFVLQHYKLQPDEVMFIGDSLKDYDFAKDKKVDFIGLSRIFEKIEFQKKGLLSVSCLTDLIKLFDQSEKYFDSFEKVKL